MNKKTIIELTVFFIIASILLIGFISFYPNAPSTITQVLHDYDQSNKEAHFTIEQLEEIDDFLYTGLDVRDFREMGWCMDKSRQGNEIHIHSLEPIPDENRATFYNFLSCDTFQATLHTHHPILGELYPSPKDEQIFTDRPEIDCIAHGSIDTQSLETGDEIDRVKCFNQDLEELKTILQ